MRYLSGLALCVGVIVCLGCGGGAPGVEGVVPVTGTVTYQGKPVEGATVTFSPQGGAGRAASGKTDAEGHFQLTTLQANDGAKPGQYQVAVSKVEVEGAMTPEESQAYFEKHGRPPVTTTKHLLPEKYSRATSSGLTANIKEGGENNFEFKLE